MNSDTIRILIEQFSLLLQITKVIFGRLTWSVSNAAAMDNALIQKSPAETDERLVKPKTIFFEGFLQHTSHAGQPRPNRTLNWRSILVEQSHSQST